MMRVRLTSYILRYSFFLGGDRYVYKDFFPFFSVMSFVHSCFGLNLRPLAAHFKSQIFLSINWHVFITVIVYCSELLNHSLQPHCRRMICDELFEKPCCSLNSLRVGQ